MSVQWYFSRNNQQEGPAAETEIRRMVAAGELQPNDYVCEVGGTAWKRVFEVPQLQGSPAPAAPTPPAMPPMPGGQAQQPVNYSPQSKPQQPGSNALEDFGRQTMDAARTATNSAAAALKTLFADPLGGQQQSVTTLGDSKALLTGVVFHAVFFVTCLIAWYSFPLFALIPRDFGVFMRFFMMSLMPSVALTGGFFLIAQIYRKPVSWQTSLFLAGTALLPVAAFLLAFSLFSRVDSDIAGIIIFVALVFANSLFVMLANAALQTVHGLTTRQAVLLTPGLLTFMFFIQYLAAKVIMS